MNFSEQIREHPLRSAVLTVVFPSLLGLIVAYKAQDNELRKILYTASVTLIFGGFIGGLLKILLDDFTLSRNRRLDNAMFVTNVLADLKSVYDRVGRVRILIPAHKSAKTYGDEMRDLIEARVTLLNVIRAVDRRTAGLSEDVRKQVSEYVTKMEEYLGRLTGEFRAQYKNVSNHQRIHEARVQDKLKDDEHATVDQVFGTETVWDELLKLNELQGLIDDSSASPYKREFERHLDDASRVLREQLRRILAGETVDNNHHKEERS